MTDWTAFLLLATQTTNHYSDSDLKRCLVYLDSAVLEQLTMKDRLLLRTGTTTSKWVRDATFAKLFRFIKQSHPDLFLQAPLEAVTAYNALVDSLFSDAVAQELHQAVTVRRMEATLPLPKTALIEEVVVVPTIQPQKNRLQEIEQFLLEQKEAAKPKIAPFMNKLFTPEFMAFADLPAEVNRIVLENYEPDALDEQDLTDELVAKYKEEAASFYDGRIVQLEKLVTVAHERQEKLSAITKFSHDFVVVTEPLKGFKDIQEEYTALATLVNNLPMDRHQFVKEGYSDNEQKLSSHYQEYLQIKANMPKTLDTLLAKAKMAEVQAQDSKAAIKRRLFEIFWNISPYLDLTEDFHDMRALLTEELSVAMHKFYSGALSAHELLEVCQEMPYEHDVVKLRNEITHRSARLKDLRDELLRLLKELEQAKAFLEIIEAQEDTTYKSITSCLTQISSILAEVENPFKAFKKAETKDDINYVFRNFWIQIEGVQTQVEAALIATVSLLQNGAPKLEKAFLQAVDTLEEVLMAKNGTRTQLVVPMQRQLQFSPGNQLYSAILSALHGLEKSYPFVEPFALFMRTHEHKIRFKMMQEADILDARIAETIAFAKAMQYVKTFEEERVDVILEAFERQHVIEEQDWNAYIERLHRACRLVEDEIFLDIGLLDRHALMDVDVQELNKALIIATNRAIKHIYESHYGVLADLEGVTLTETLCQKTLSDCKKSLEAWAKVSVDDIKNTDWLLMHLRKYCHHLFDAKILLGTQNKILLPKCLDFVCDLRSLEKYIRSSVQAKRNQQEAEWGHPWIKECHDIREEIESFEQDEETEDAFRPLLKKIYSIAEKIPEVDPAKLETFQQELERHLQEIDELSERPQKDYPFIYIPGYLAFFSSRGKN
ncbi:MAG: hypothetical protein LLF94_04240 [Chlamydiales bacterium]|nr:hypothetical protein [Chlamydiales bacterium]